MLRKLKQLNKLRVSEFGHGDIMGWSPTDWGCAVAGETGELCNLLKKVKRGEDIPIKDIAYEIADVLIYLDLVAQRMGIDLEEAMIEKFNLKSDEIGSKIKF